MSGFNRLLRSFIRCERGVSAMEYAMIATLIAVVIIVAVTQIGTSVNSMFASVKIPAG